MGWIAKMKEVLRATWANNNGGAGERQRIYQSLIAY